MLAQILRRAAWGLALTLFLAGASSDTEKTNASTAAPDAAAKRENPALALEFLQKAHAAEAKAFVVQGELDPLIREGGGGACASAAGIDLLQAVRVMTRLEKLPNPHQVVLASFADQPELLDGRVSNEQLVQLIAFYDAHYLDGAKLILKVESAPNSPHLKDNRTWSESAGPNLSVTPRQIKVLSYTVTESNGKVRGRHFVLLREQKGNEIVVVDPAKPAKDRRYIVECKPGERGSCERVFLLQPAGVPARSLIYELNTVFQVSIVLDEGGSGPRPADNASIEDIKTRINHTASDLRGTKDFLSPRVWRERTASFGLPGLDLPVEHGGSDWPATKMVEIFRHAGRYNLNFRDIVGGAHVRALLKSTNPEVLKIVRRVASGRGYIAIAITEPSAGSDIPAIKSTSRKVDGGYLLSGTKKFNARLDQATHVILFTQGTTGEQGKLSVFVLPIDTPGLTIEQLTAHGLTGNSYSGLSFNSLFVQESHRIEEDGKGLGIFFEHFLYWRLMQTAAAIGTGENALEQMAERIRTREAFGGPIGRFTHLQQPIGQYWTELRMAHALAPEAAELIDRGDYRAARPLICGLKAEGVEITLNAVDAAMRAFGGEGYSNLVDLGDRLRDPKRSTNR